MKDWYIKEGLIDCILSPFITQVNHVYLSVAYRFHLESGGKSRLRTLCDGFPASESVTDQMWD